MYWEPHEYQKKAVKFLVENGSGQLWLDPGLGKTSITLEAFKILKAAGVVKKALILAPLRPA
jgi:superfamily II DNA or RNA helicase